MIQESSPIPPHLHDEQKNEKEQKETHWKNRFIVIISISVIAVAIGILVTEVAVLTNEIVREKIWRSNPEELEQKVADYFSVHFIDKIKSLSTLGLDQIHLFKRLAISQEDEIKIISYLEENFEISPEQLKEILMGAHVRLDDNGQTYEDWLLEIATKQSRISSHPSDTTQYGVQGSLIKELLFSRMREKDQDGSSKDYTWFQLENHPVSFGHIIRHMIDYVKYKMTNQNQGPYGSSEATDRAPIILKLKPKDESERISELSETSENQ